VNLARLLILAPHPDDESLACAGLIQHCHALGGQASILWATSGDGFRRDARELNHTWRPTAAEYLDLGRRRMREANAAAAVLGVDPSRRYFLGFPDGALGAVMASASPVTSPTTGQQAAPYPDALRPGAPYTRHALVALLAAVVVSTQPTLLALPAHSDQNADHRAVAQAAREALAQAGVHPQVASYVVHIDMDLYPLLRSPVHPLILDPGALPKPHVLVPLTDAMRTVKRRAIAAHASQMRAMGPWLMAFDAKDEPLHFPA
jgi:LmbE family N-acetylglucosaminyl deacetylase